MIFRVVACASCVLFLCAPEAFAADAPNGRPASPPDYEDRLIDGGALAADVSADAFAGNNPEGWPRAFRLQATTSRLTRNGVATSETGLRLGGMLETPDYGSFTVEANVRTADDYGFGSGNLFTLLQRGLPMNGGWFANNALGVFNTPTADLARQQYRFYMPTIPTNGAATEWRQDGNLQLYASAGQPGVFTGIYIPTFEGLGGRLLSAGAQWNISREWSAALQTIDVEDVRFGIGPNFSLGKLSSRGWFGATAWTGASARAQLNVVNSATEGGPNRTGLWVDTAVRDGRVLHTFGGFRLDPNLVWGNQPLTSNLQGGYYRASFQNRQWILDGGVDYVAPVSGEGGATLFGTTYARYQYSSRLGFGGGANVRQGPSDAWSVFGFVDQANPWGLGRAQVNYAADRLQDYTQITLDQTWSMPAGTRLSTGVLVGRENLQQYSTNTVGIAVYGGGELRSNLTLDLNARWSKALGDASADNALANVALNWTFAPGWLASASYYENRTTGRLPLTVTSPIPGTPLFFEQRFNDRGVFFTLRYEWQAGTRSAPLGGVPGSGAGSVSGVLYLDGNDNGRLDAGEGGAANVMILLDGRFATRTNSEGRFEFPSVAAGDHVLTVVPDNLPLPWAVPGEGQTRVQVGVRDQTRIELPARRLR